MEDIESRREKERGGEPGQHTQRGCDQVHQGEGRSVGAWQSQGHQDGRARFSQRSQ